MRWCNVQTKEYNLQAKTNLTICTHYKQHNNNENKIPVSRNVYAISDRIILSLIAYTFRETGILFSLLLLAGLAGFFHLVEETGLNPGLNRPGRNRFLPPEVEETGKKFEMGD